MRFGVLATALLTAVACRQSVADPVSLVVTIETSPPALQRGDTLTVVVSATGNNLVGVVVEYGDSQGDQYSTGGAHSARVTFKHAFMSQGSYTIRAIVTDAVAGEKEAVAQVTVN